MSDYLIKKQYLLLSFLLIALFDNTGFANNKEKRFAQAKVLLLNSYHKGFKWTDEITRGVEETLEGNVGDLHIEYMDTKRQFGKEYQILLTDLLKLKIATHKYEVIITSDNNAFDFIKTQGKEIVGDIPVVFCGVNYIQDSDIEGFDNVTGVNENANIVDNIFLIQKVHPTANSILIITDNTSTGKRIQEEVRRIKKDESLVNIHIELVYDIAVTKLIENVRSLDANTVILYTLFFRDKNDVFFEYDESAKMICNNSQVPVYGTWDFSLNYGIVGGYLTTGFEQGKIAAEKALQYLGGTSIQDIPILFNSPYIPIFDYNILHKYSIELSKLPKNASIINQQVSFFHRNKLLLKNLVLIFLLMSLAIIGLVFGYARSLKLKRQLKESKVQLSSLIANMPGAVYRCVADNKWKMIYLSENIYKISGYKASDFIGNRIRPISSIIHPEDISKVKCGIDSALENNKLWEITYRIIHCSGSIRWVTEFGRGIKNEFNELEYLDGLILEITKRKLAEDELKNSELRFKNIFDNSPLGTFYYNQKGIIIDCNESFASILGTIKERLIGLDLINDLEDETLIAEVKNSLLLGTGFYSDYYQSITSGKTVPVKAIFKGVADFTGIFNSGIGVVQDVTEQKQAEKEILKKNNQLRITNETLVATATALQDSNNDLVKALEKAQKNDELEKANKLLMVQKVELENTLKQLKDAQMQLIQSEKMASVGILTSGIAHEINNPLNYIQGGKTAIEMYIHDNQLNISDKLNPYLEMIDTGISRAVEIVKGLNHFNRTSEDFTENCNIHAILDNCLIMLNNQMKHRIEVKKAYTNSVYTLFGNEGRLHQLFLNIIRNASQAIDDNGSIIISTHLNLGNIVVSIVDTGSGISEENMKKISDPFFTTKPPGKGTGLGLSIAYSIINEHKGTINYESQVNIGTKVLVTLPVKV